MLLHEHVDYGGQHHPMSDRIYSFSVEQTSWHHSPLTRPHTNHVLRSIIYFVTNIIPIPAKGGL